MLNTEESLLYVNRRHIARVKRGSVEILNFRRKSLNCRKDDSASRRSDRQLPRRAAADVSSIADVMVIQAEAERVVGIILGIPWRVKDAVARPDGPLVAGCPSNTDPWRELFVVAILDCAQFADRPSKGFVALSAKENGSFVC